MGISGEPPSGELPPMPKPEGLSPKPPEAKTPEAQPLGQAEQAIVSRIDKDGDPDLTLQDLAKPEVSQATVSRAEIKPSASSSTEAAGMDLDPRYKVIQGELKQKWLQEHPGQDFLSEAGQNYNLGYVDLKQKHLSTLKSDTERLFREKYTEDAKVYDQKEKSRVYDNPSDDPAIKQTEEDILATNLDPQVRNANTVSGIDNYGNVWNRVNTRETIHAWSKFIDQYPEKAKVYAEKGHTELKKAFEGREKQRQQREKQQTTLTEKAQIVKAKHEAKRVSSAQEVSKRIHEQVAGSTKALTLEDLERRRQELKNHPQLSSKTLTDTLVGVDKQATFSWAQTDKIVGRTWEQPDSWASEIEARKGRVAQVAKEIIDSDGNPQTMERIFHPEKTSERIKLTAIMGPAGPMYYVDDGTHRIAASMAAGIAEIPCDVKGISYPLEQVATDGYQAEDWERKIDKGLIDGEIQDYISENGRKMKKLIIRSEILPWIRTTSQTDLIKISRVYEQLYPGSLDNLTVPKQTLLDPIANNYYMAGRWEEWVRMNQPKS